MLAVRQRVLHYLIGLVAVYKVAYFFEYAALPFLYGPIFDSAVYDAQAQAVRAGVFGDATLLAFSPLYGYFLALFPIGEFVYVVVAQLALGFANVFMVHRIALRMFGTREALAAASLYFGYGLFSFYETKVLSETLGLSLALISLLLSTSDAVRLRGEAKSSLAAGALLALAVLARASLLFSGCASVVCAFLPWGSPRESARIHVQRGASFAAGFALLLCANGAWNYTHTGFFVPVIFVSHTAAAAANVGEQWHGDLAALSANADGDVSAWDVVEQARDRLAHRGHESTTTTRLTDLNVSGILRSAPAKILSTLSDQETTFDYGFYGERTEVKSLYLLPLSFACLVLFGVLGAFFLARTHGANSLWVFLPFIVGTLATTVLFHPSSRYRLPMGLPLVLLGGYGLVRAYTTERVRTRRVLCGALLVATLALVTRHELHSLRAPAWWELRVAEAAAAAGDLATVEQRVRRARELAPSDSQLQRRLNRLSQINGDVPH